MSSNYMESMNEIMSTLLIHIDNAKKNIRDITNKLDINVELEENKQIISKIKKTFDGDQLDELICRISENKFIIDNLINNIYICDHEWIDDVIDIDPDTSKHICYCIKCEVTKL